jgi:hypothetical protein
VCGRPQQRELGGLDVTVYPLLHPAAALRTPASLDKLREDMSRIPALLEELAPPKPVLETVAVGAGDPAQPVAPEASQLDLFG